MTKAYRMKIKEVKVPVSLILPKNFILVKYIGILFDCIQRAANENNHFLSKASKVVTLALICSSRALIYRGIVCKIRYESL